MAWSAGMPALATLVGVTLAALALAHFATARTGSGLEIASPVDRTVRKLQAHAIATGVAAAVFWAWAVANTVMKGFDLGAVSFLAVLGSSSTQYARASDTTAYFTSNGRFFAHFL